MKIAEFSRATGLSDKTIRDWVRRGVLKFETDASGRLVFDETACYQIDNIVKKRLAIFRNQNFSMADKRGR